MSSSGSGTLTADSFGFWNFDINGWFIPLLVACLLLVAQVAVLVLCCRNLKRSKVVHRELTEIRIDKRNIEKDTHRLVQNCEEERTKTVDLTAELDHRSLTLQNSEEEKENLLGERKGLVEHKDKLQSQNLELGSRNKELQRLLDETAKNLTLLQERTKEYQMESDEKSQRELQLIDENTLFQKNMENLEVQLLTTNGEQLERMSHIKDLEDNREQLENQIELYRQETVALGEQVTTLTVKQQNLLFAVEDKKRELMELGVQTEDAWEAQTPQAWGDETEVRDMSQSPVLPPGDLEASASTHAPDKSQLEDAKTAQYKSENLQLLEQVFCLQRQYDTKDEDTLALQNRYDDLLSQQEMTQAKLMHETGRLENMQSNLKFYEDRLQAFSQMQDMIADSNEMVVGFQKSTNDIQRELEGEKDANEQLTIDLEQEKMRSHLLFQILRHFKMKMIQSASKLPPLQDLPPEVADTWQDAPMEQHPSLKTQYHIPDLSTPMIGRQY